MVKNLISNYLGRLWAVSSNFLFVPIYILILGQEAFGLIAFYSTIAMLISVMNLGLTSATTRYIAQERINQKSLDTIKSVELFLVCLSALIVLVIYFLAPVISERWITVQTLEFDSVVLSIRLMAFIAVIEIIFSIYLGAYMALEKQVEANWYQFLFSFSKTALVIPIIYITSNVVSFFYWGASASLLVFILVRLTFWKKLSSNIKPRYSLISLWNLKAFALGMGAIGILSAVNSQLDKILISSSFDLAEFGVYSLASIISQVPLIVSTPIAMTVLPRLSLLVKQKQKIYHLYFNFSLLVVIVSLLVSLIISINPIWLISTWTGENDLPLYINHLVRFLLLSNLMLSLQLLPFQVLIAHGYTKLNIVLSLIALIVLFPLMIYFIKEYGLIGVAYPWVLMNFLALNAMVYFTSKKYLGMLLRNAILFSLSPTIIYILFIFFL